MKNRRNFLKSSALLATGLAVSAPLLAKSKTTNQEGSGFPGIIFTEEKQGRWEGKAGSHVPVVTLKGTTLTMQTFHPMTNEHYIVRHTLVDKNGKLLGAKTFHPSDVRAISTFELPGNFHGKLYATSFCNKHDFWLKEFSV